MRARCFLCLTGHDLVPLRYVPIATGECDEIACRSCARDMMYRYPALWAVGW